MQLSAFVDGELPENEAEMLLRRLSQDVELRQQVSEYMAIGRVMRGEAQVTGVEQLRGRIAGVLNEGDEADAASIETEADDRLIRPLAGFAIAATVALAAIFGLREFAGVDAADVPPPVVAIQETEFPTQPEVDDVLDQYRRLHDAEAADSNMHTRLTSVEVRQEIAEGNDTVEAADTADAVDDDADQEGVATE